MKATPQHKRMAMGEKVTGMKKGGPVTKPALGNVKTPKTEPKMFTGKKGVPGKSGVQ